MTIQDFGSIGEFVAAIATILTLGYLALQIRLSARASIAEAERQTLSEYTAHLADVYGDERSTSLMLRGLVDGLDQLSDAEAMMFSARMSHLVMNYWIGTAMSDKKLLDEEILTRMHQTLSMYLRSPGGSEWWEKTGRVGWPHLVEDFEEYDGISFDQWFKSLRGAEVAAAY